MILRNNSKFIENWLDFQPKKGLVHYPKVSFLIGEIIESVKITLKNYELGF